LIFLLFCLAGFRAQAQTEPGVNDPAGVWKGSSTCQVKNSPCHDEMVVYYITKSNGADSFEIRAFKIVNGKEEEMGILSFRYDSRSRQFVSASSQSLWTLEFKGNELHGTLIFRGSLYRIVKLVKEP
jgi:hypothetical protein